jgi:hypothetical protein
VTGPVSGAGGPGDLDARVERLERRLDVVESVLALHDLKARYGDLVDARFFRGAVVASDRLAELAGRAAALFTEDGVWDGGPGLGVAHGREEIAARLASPTLVFSRHLFVRPRIHVAGEEATGRWELLSPCTRPDGTSLWMSGVEDDVYARVDGVWLHRSMTLTTMFVSPAGTGWPRILA